ncbi:MAG: hypothetical protein ABFD07_02400, partial [Methanobacterium sp.]
MGEFYIYAFLNGSIPATGSEEWQLKDSSLPFQPFYVGKGTNGRIYEHFRPSNLQTETPFYRKLRKLIRENSFDDTLHIVKLYENLTEEEAWKKEFELINYWGRKTKKNEGWGILYNIADGGAGGNTLTEFNRASARKAHKRRMQIVVNDAYRQKCSCSKIDLWKNLSSTEKQVWDGSIREQARARTLSYLQKNLLKKVIDFSYITPFGSFKNLHEGHLQAIKMLGSIPSTMWRTWFYINNNKRIEPRVDTSYKNVRRSKISRSWDLFPFLHQFEGKTFFEAGFYIKVFYEDQS